MKLSIIAALTAAIASFTVAMPIEGGEIAAVSEVDEAAHVLMRRTDCTSTHRANTAHCKNIIEDLLAGGSNVLFAFAGGWKSIGAHGNCVLWAQSGTKFATTSYSRDVGYGARSIIDQCAHGGTVAGYNTAGGNGDFHLWMTMNN